MDEERWETTLGDKRWMIKPLSRKEYKNVVATFEMAVCAKGIQMGPPFNNEERAKLAEEIMAISGITE